MNLYPPATPAPLILHNFFAQGNARRANHMRGPGQGPKTFASASNNICSECIMTVKVDTNEHSLLLILMRFSAHLVLPWRRGGCPGWDFGLGVGKDRKFLLRKLLGMRDWLVVHNF